jgi:hypothetical protein
MNRTIIIAIALVASAIAATAQNKPVSAPTRAATVKPTYQTDPGKIFVLGGRITAQQMNDFFMVIQNGLPAIESHPQLTGAQITTIKNNYKIVSDTLYSRFVKFIRDDQASFTADTTKQFHPKK